MTNTEAKYGEPWSILSHKSSNGFDEFIVCRERIFDTDFIAVISSRHKDGPNDKYTKEREAFANRIVACVNAFSGHDPSDSVVLSRERWEKIKGDVEAIVDNAQRVGRSTLEGDLAEIVTLAIYARSALAAAERGRG